MQNAASTEKRPRWQWAGEDPGTTRAVRALRPGDHLCSLYQTEEERRALLTPYLREGLRSGQRVLHLPDDGDEEAVLDYLRSDGVDVAQYLASGQLRVLEASAVYARDGTFDPASAVALLRDEAERAQAEGYAALRVSSEMTWALRGLAGSERLVELESQLGDLVPNLNCLVLCQYDRRRFAPALLLDVLAAHPTVFAGTAACGNLFHIPSRELLEQDREAALLDRWLGALVEHHRARSLVRRLSSAVEQSPATVVITDTRGNIEYVNPKFTQLTGYTFEEAIGRNPRILKSGETPPEVYKELWRTVLSGGEWAGRLHNRKKNGELYWEYARISPITDARGTITHLIAIKEDVTERVAMQERLAAANEELRLRNEELQRQQQELQAQNERLQAQAEELRQLEKMREEFLHTISHDLRQPLTVIQGQAQILGHHLSKEGGESRQARSLQAIRANAQRMASMIRDLVDSARLESGHLELNLEPKDLYSFLGDVVERAGTPEERARIQLSIGEWVPPVLVDPERLERALVNLITNALKFSPPDRPVVIQAGQAEGQAVISVVDEGIGIPAEDLGRLFERYYRGASGKKRAEGLGLGLYITRLIVEAHGGKIWVESEPDKGSKFHLALPLA